MIPDVGMNAAMENIQEIRELLSSGTKMVFVTAGMGVEQVLVLLLLLLRWLVI